MDSILIPMIGATTGAVVTSAVGVYVFYKQLSKERDFLYLQKIESILFILNTLLHKLDIISKSKKSFFDDPDKYLQSSHPEAEQFEDYSQYYDYNKVKSGLILGRDFYDNIQKLKAYILMYVPNLSERIRDIEKNVLEVNPMEHLAGDVSSEYFSDLNNLLNSIHADLKFINMEVINLIYKKFTKKYS